MKKILLVLLAVSNLSLSSSVQAEGTVNFVNSSATMITVAGTNMPVRADQEFLFAVFLAPATTVNASGFSANAFDVNFQLPAGYTTNSSLVAGRFVSRISLDVGSIAGYNAGDNVDFVVRGWSSNLGYTWSDALSHIQSQSVAVNDGLPAWYGSSLVGNDLLLGGGVIPVPALFGVASYSVPGFNLSLVPEPSVPLLAGLGMLALLSRRRQ